MLRGDFDRDACSILLGGQHVSSYHAVVLSRNREQDHGFVLHDSVVEIVEMVRPP